MLGALGTGIGVTLFAQLMLPTAFLHVYGVERYGEWLVLSAAMSYLLTMNFGITTYAANELTILHQRGEDEQYRVMQASTLAMIIGLLTLGTLVCSFFLLLPLREMLHLKTLSASDSRWTAFWLGMQMVVNITFGYYSNLFMVVGKAHRGVNWYNARRMAPALCGVLLIFLHASFSGIALGQLLAMLVVCLLSIVDLKFCMPNLPLGIGGASWSSVRQSLLPSGMFGVANLQNLLLFQGPVIVLQWVLGPASVVIFAIGRTILSIARQLLTTLTDALKPEITMLWAAHEQKRLLRLFHDSEKVMYFAIPTVNMGTYLFSPLILRFWVHRDGLFDVFLYGMLAMISCAISMREHKQFFHYATNTHHRYAVIVFVGNLAMVLASIPATIWLGVNGLLFVWLISEVVQMLMIYQENRRLFQYDASIRLRPALLLLVAMGGSFAICYVLLRLTLVGPLWRLALSGCVGTVTVAGGSYCLFDVCEIREQLLLRLRQQVGRRAIAD